jgi:hypothetical protein
MNAGLGGVHEVDAVAAGADADKPDWIIRIADIGSARYGAGKRLSAASIASNLATICGVTT